MKHILIFWEKTILTQIIGNKDINANNRKQRY